MSKEDGTKIIYGRTPESAAMLANVKRAMAITAMLNRTFPLFASATPAQYHSRSGTSASR
jgi:hypothetical protein